MTALFALPEPGLKIEFYGILRSTTLRPWTLRRQSLHSNRVLLTEYSMALAQSGSQDSLQLEVVAVEAVAFI